MPKETASPERISVQKRALPNPRDVGYGIIPGDFIMVQMHNAQLVDHGLATIGSTALTGQLDNTCSSWGVTNLYGCTSVIVVSRKRVWISHFWEDPAFIVPTNLIPHILDPLQNGVFPGIPQGIGAFTGPGGDFENTPENKVRAFIVTLSPRGVDNPATNALQYPCRVRHIQERVKTVLSQPDRDPLIIPYIPRWRNDLYNSTGTYTFPWGKVLVQYDPVQVRETDRGGCTRQYAKLEIWVEDKPLVSYADMWLALANQVVPQVPGGYIKRRVAYENFEEFEKPNDFNDLKDFLKHRDGDSCPLPSSRPSGSSSGQPTSARNVYSQSGTGINSAGLSQSTSFTSNQSISVTTSYSNLIATDQTQSAMTSKTTSGVSAPAFPSKSTLRPASGFTTNTIPVTTLSSSVTLSQSSSTDSPCPNSIQVPGQCGVPGCAYIIASDLGGGGMCPADYCNCGGTPAPLLTGTVSGSATVHCGYTTQPESECPSGPPRVTAAPSPAPSSTPYPSSAMVTTPQPPVNSCTPPHDDYLGDCTRM